jgi:hypothetical protein
VPLWEPDADEPGRPAALPGRNATVDVFLEEPWNVRRLVEDDEVQSTRFTFTSSALSPGAATHGDQH